MSFPFLNLPSPLQLIDEKFGDNNVKLYIKRDDLIHPWINGNKWRKLQYNLPALKSNKRHTLVSFGGAFSNHLVAVASSAFELGLKSVGFVRSYKADLSNPTLSILNGFDMDVHFIHPHEYDNKEKSPVIKRLLADINHPHIIPEGGTNELAIEGVKSVWKEIEDQSDVIFDQIILSIGTGGTLAGIANTVPADLNILAGSPFKGTIEFLEGFKFLKRPKNTIDFVSVLPEKKFGSYDAQLVEYINAFYSKYSILLDPIYTGRTMKYLENMVRNKVYNTNKNLLFLHTGGLQGILGYNYLYGAEKKIIIPKSEAYRFLTNPATTFGKK